ncbi:MAG: hypothetical protein AB8G77_18590 [Rhodothermales bacterium]
MKQTLLAFLAMSLFSLLALSQQRVALKYHGMVYGRDIEMAGVDMALNWITSIEGASFDEVDTGTSGNPRTNTTGLTSSDALGPELQDFQNSEGRDDLDDFNGIDTSYVYVFQGRDYPFKLKIDVQYVRPDNPNLMSATPTLTKEVTVAVSESDSVMFERPPVKVEIKRVFSPAQLRYH